MRSKLRSRAQGGSFAARFGLVVALLWTSATLGQGTTKKDAAAPPAAPPGESMAHYVPRENLVVYFEFAGTEANAEAWKKTSAYKILNETSTGAMLEDLAAQLIDKIPQNGPGRRLSGSDVVAVVKHMFQYGFVSGYYAKKQPGSPSGLDPAASGSVLVYRGAFRKESRPLFAKLLGTRFKPADKAQTSMKPGNRKVVTITPSEPRSAPLTWWIEKEEDLVLVPGPPGVADAVIDVLEKKAESAVTHPVRAELVSSQGEGFQPLVCTFAIASDFPMPPGSGAEKFFSQINIKGVKRLDFLLGMDGPALVSVAQVIAPSPRVGVLSLFDQPPFELNAVPPLPASIDGFNVVSVDLKSVYDRVVDRAKASGPEAEAQLEEFEKTVKAKTRARFREDILGRIGPRIAMYSVPPKASSATPSSNPLSGLLGGGLQVPKTVIVADVKDSVGLGKVLDEVMLLVNKEMEQQAIKAAEAAADPDAAKDKEKRKTPVAAPKFRIATTNPKTYVLSLPPAQAAFSNLNLTIALSKKHLVIATASDVAKQVLALEAKSDGRWTPSGDVAQSVEGLPKGMTFLQVNDPTKTMPEALANLPQTVQAIGSMIVAANSGDSAPSDVVAGAAAGPGAGGDDRERRGFRGGGGRGPQAASPGGGGPGPQAATPGGGGRPGPQAASPGGGGPGPQAASPGGGPQTQPGGAPGESGSSGPATFELKIDPSKNPSADSVRGFLFPGTVAVTVNEQGIRITRREAFPDLAMGLTPSKAVMLAMFLPAIKSAREAAIAKAQGRPVPPIVGLPGLGGVPASGAAPGGIRPPGGAPGAPAGAGGGGVRPAGVD